jgi:hypothetical protein
VPAAKGMAGFEKEASRSQNRKPAPFSFDLSLIVSPTVAAAYNAANMLFTSASSQAV